MAKKDNNIVAKELNNVKLKSFWTFWHIVYRGMGPLSRICETVHIMSWLYSLLSFHTIRAVCGHTRTI